MAAKSVPLPASPTPVLLQDADNRTMQVIAPGPLFLQLSAGAGSSSGQTQIIIVT